VTSRNRQTRAALFAKGAAAVTRVLGPRFPELADRYICPLCLREFPAEALAQHPPQLTIEHAPPKAAKVGRWPIALTCLECNARGHPGEAHLAEYTRRLSFLRSRKLEPRRTLVTKGGVSVRALLAVDGAVGTFSVSNRDNDPELVRRFRQEAGKPSEMRWEIPFRYEGRGVELALLKAAYVGAFALFGYRYVYGVPALRAVRKELKETTDTLEGFVGRWSDALEPSLRLVVCPQPVSTLMVEIGLNTVALPWFGAGSDFHERLAAIMSPGGPQRFAYSRVEPWPRTLILSEDFGREPPKPDAWAEAP
jgi:hypothetical protein